MNKNYEMTMDQLVARIERLEQEQDLLHHLGAPELITRATQAALRIYRERLKRALSNAADTAFTK